MGSYCSRVMEAMGELLSQAILDSQKKLIYASWHQRFFPGITFFSTRKPIAIIISKSRDREMAARAVDILGWHSVRGSSSHGGKEALEEIKALGSAQYKVGHIVDGPQGPLGVIKPGLLRIFQGDHPFWQGHIFLRVGYRPNR